MSELYSKEEDAVVWEEKERDNLKRFAEELKSIVNDTDDKGSVDVNYLFNLIETLLQKYLSPLSTEIVSLGVPLPDNSDWLY